MLKIVIVSVLLTLAISSKGVNTLKRCPSGWTYFVSKCYHFSTYKTTWFEARAACQKLEGDLVVFTNSKENNVVGNIAKQKKMIRPWIGLVRHKDKKFYTVQGIKPSYKNWNPGEPNGPNHENCVHFADSIGRWNDIPCSNKYHFICQKPIIKHQLICGENKIKIFIRKSLLHVLSASQLQLLDSSCKPRETNSYYIFTTSLTACGTTMTENAGKTVSFHNKVVERLSGFGKSISRSEEINFPFKCNYPQSYLLSSGTFGLTNYTVSPNNAGGEANMSVTMGLYKDQSFSIPLVGDPSLNERLYVEVGLKGTNSSSEKSSFGIKLNECYVTSKNGLAEYKYLLIERGCKKDKTVKFHQTSREATRFSFLVFRFRGLHHYNTRVHCRVSVCEKKNKSCHLGCRSSRKGKRMLSPADDENMRYFF